MGTRQRIAGHRSPLPDADCLAWQNDAAAFAEADGDPPFGTGEAAQNDFIAIKKIKALLAGGEHDRGSSPGGRFEKAAAAIGRVCRDGAGAEEIAGIEIDAANGVVRDKLRDGPIEVCLLYTSPSPRDS